MQRVYTTTIVRARGSKPNEHKVVLTFTKGAKKKALRLSDIACRKRIHSITDVVKVAVDGFGGYSIDMLYGEELVVTASANRAVNVLVSEKREFEEWRTERAEWCNVEEAFLLPYPPYYEAKEEVKAETSLKFYATLNTTFFVSVFNCTSKTARATIEIVNWGRREE